MADIVADAGGMRLSDDEASGDGLTRRQREEIEEQRQARLAARGKTDQARADLQRLEEIRREREVCPSRELLLGMMCLM